MANRRRKRDPCIPGLVPQAFTKGSWHEAPVPTLKTSYVDQETGECKFVWQAKGSLGSYDIKANGKLEIREPQCGDVPEWKGLKVTCSCPDEQ